jgi:hypothetical protein
MRGRETEYRVTSRFIHINPALLEHKSEAQSGIWLYVPFAVLCAIYSEVIDFIEWRKCMGIEPTQQLFTATLVLKSEPV